MSNSVVKYFPQPWFVLLGLETTDTATRGSLIKQYNDDYRAVVQNMSNNGELEEFFKKFPAPEWYGKNAEVTVGIHKFRIYRWSDNYYLKNKDRLDGAPIFPFYGHKNDIRATVTKSCLSQWYKSDFVVDGIKYCCMEQYMMAQKALLFGDSVNYFKIMGTDIPRDMKRLGRQVKGFDSDIWDSVSMDIVRTGNYHKFTQNEKLMEFLLNTGNTVLVEASPYDHVWGAGIDDTNPDIYMPSKWKGRNLLGFCLMQVRDNIRAVYANYSDVDLDKTYGLVNKA